MVGGIIIFELFVLICCEGWGRIINMSPVVGLLSYSSTIGYCSTKTGLFGLTKVWCVLFSWLKITDPWIRACLRRSLLHLLLCSKLWSGSNYLILHLVKKMIKHVQVHDINGIKKIKLRFSIIKEETQYHCINEIQYLYINTTGCVCNVLVFFIIPQCNKMS